MTAPERNRLEIDKLLGELAVVLDDVVSLVSHGDFLIGSVHKLLQAPRAATQEPPTVLLVDDDVLVLKSMSRGLGDAFEVITASTVPDAIALLKEHAFDAVVSDYRLDEGNGVDVLRVALREQPQALRVLHTGERSEAVERLKGGHLVQQVVEKPTEAAELVELLTTLLREGRGA